MRRLQGERGSAIVMAIALMAAMLAVGLAAYSFVDTQQVQSMRERQRESSFNLTEGALNAQSFVLSRHWAGTDKSYPKTAPTCSQASAPIAYCPDVSQLLAGYNTPDYASGTVWSTTIWDDAAGDFYDASRVENPATNVHWDANRNRRVWVRAQATVRDRRKTVVALVEVQEHVELLPKRVILAGQFKLTPNGNHKYVLTNPDQTSTHPVTLRCNLNSPSCAEYTPDKKNPQIDPPEAIEGQQYIGQDALEDDVKQRLKERAIADGTYYKNTCPTQGQLSGKIVWVEGCAYGNYTKNWTWNSPTDPGLLVWSDGILELGGKSDFYGVVYHLNNADSDADDLVRLRGGLTIHGGVFVDGPGGIDVGSNSVNITFDGNAFISVSSYGSANIVQNSWRDITGG
jgi:hypothetical protein